MAAIRFHWHNVAYLLETEGKCAHKLSWVHAQISEKKQGNLDSLYISRKT